MSFNRDNVTWQSKDGSWNIGFWSFVETSSWDDDDYDPEWDVEYLDHSFWFVSTGHSSPDGAWNAYTRQNPNPGSTTVFPYKGYSAACKEYDRLAFRFKNPELAKKQDQAEARKQYREHQKKVAVEFAKKIEGEKLFALYTVEVLFKDTADVRTLLGMCVSTTGKLAESGDWITVSGKKIYNTKTKKLAANVHSIRFADPSYYSYNRNR